MFIRRLAFARHYLLRPLAETMRKLQTLRERQKTFEDIRKARGITLLREWLSAEQQAQFDTSKCFDVIGCDSGKRYRIRHGTGMNIHEIDDAAGDVMLAQKIALETNEHAALAVANRFTVHISAQTNSVVVPRAGY
jgi:hypothetical protein